MLWKWVLACKHSATAILNRKREVMGYRSMLVYYNNALNTNTKKRDSRKRPGGSRMSTRFPRLITCLPKDIRERTFGEVDQQQQLQQYGRSLVLGRRMIFLLSFGSTLMITTHLRGSSEAAPRRIGSLIFPDQLNDDEAADDDQEWIENLESILEVDDEAQQPLQQMPIQQQFEQRTKTQQSESVAYICLDDLQPQQQSRIHSAT
ncbi:hypothetical protein Sjap_025983 [Stephania japonica]|uniref:Uncharacterized protein n=1 Tax=Stephania japonica TaxID=461633 RepID=A0AAP0HI23_9MAGN